MSQRTKPPTQRISQQQLESYLWGAAVLLRGTIDAGDYKQFIFPLLFYKRLCDVFDEETMTALRESGGDQNFALFPENHRFQIPLDAHWQEIRKASRDVGRSLQKAMRTIETANPDKLSSIFGDAQWTNKDRLPDAMLRDLIEHFSSLELTIANLPEDELGQGYEYLIKKFADDSGHTAAEFYTNRTVVHLMTELLDVQPSESVYDPTCGSGGMLLSCISHLRQQGKEWRNVKLYGQERNLMTSSIARMNCFLHGIEDFRIERGDTIAEPKFLEADHLMHFNVVLANPPYSIKQWDRESFQSDPWGRNLFGTPPQGRADYAFWQHIIKSLKPQSGRCAILFPHGILFRQEEAEMRRKLIEADLIECVIGLGPNLFYNSPMEACVVVCRTQKPKARRGKILFINAVNEVSRERAQSFLTEEHIERILHAYQNFKEKRCFTRVATLEEIRSRDSNLSIPLYVKNETDAQHDEAALATSTALPLALAAWINSFLELRSSVTAFDDSLPRSMTAAPNKLSANPSWAKLPFFDRRDWKSVRFGDVVDNPNVTVTDRNTRGIEKIVSLENIDSDSLHIRRYESFDSNPSFKTYFKAGQTLFGKRRAYLRKVAIAECNGVCTQNILVFESKDQKVLLPNLLPFLCRANHFLTHAIATSKGSLFPNADWKQIKNFKFDLPPLDQQRHIAEILWAVDETLQKLQGLAHSSHQSKEAVLSNKFPHDESSCPDLEACHELQDLCKEPISYGIVQAGPNVDDGIPYIRVTDMTNGPLRLEGMLRTSPDIAARFKRSTVKSGEIVCALRGPAGLLKVVPPELDGANLTQGTARLSLNDKSLTGFILRVFESPFVQRQISLQAKGSTFAELTLAALRKIRIPVIKTRPRAKLMQQLDAIEATFAAAKASIAACHNLLSELTDHFL